MLQKPFCGSSTSSTDEKWGIYITCFFDFTSDAVFLFCNFSLNDVDDGDYNDDGDVKYV